MEMPHSFLARRPSECRSTIQAPASDTVMEQATMAGLRTLSKMAEGMYLDSQTLKTTSAESISTKRTSSAYLVRYLIPFFLI
jgi:hypothetical protein